MTQDTERVSPNATPSPDSRMSPATAHMRAKLSAKAFKRPSSASVLNTLPMDGWMLWVARWLQSKPITSSDFGFLSSKLVYREVDSSQSQVECSNDSEWDQVTSLNPLKGEGNPRRVHWLIDVLQMGLADVAKMVSERYDVTICDLERFCVEEDYRKVLPHEALSKIPNQTLLYGYAHNVFDTMGKRPDLSCSLCLPSYERYRGIVEQQPNRGVKLSEGDYSAFVNRKVELVASKISAHLICFIWP